MMYARKLHWLFAIAILGIVLLGTQTKHTHAARILAFFPTPSKSHTIIQAAVADTLARAGHNVTVIGVSKNVYPKAAYEFIHIELDGGASFDRTELQQMVNKPKPFYVTIFNIVNSFISIGNQTLSHPKMREFLRNHGAGEFDLVLLSYAVNDYTMGLGAHFRCPIVSSFQVQPIFASDRLVGNPTEPSYAPVLLSNLRQPLTFWGRVVNYLVNMLEQWIIQPIFEREWQEVYK
ncbi:UDP-glycosyltransferase UGT4-like [Rhagoletis pomonella]|uniref:UDP-glycosyltransferase UGT4-like n=1 Tax=Rhagoletis pomonella TaxID=28610 RepID=UPI001785F4ED|nr:UDP-glycosyltransferase UGT4-like [Rhagoletis pomonella]